MKEYFDKIKKGHLLYALTKDDRDEGFLRFCVEGGKLTDFNKHGFSVYMRYLQSTHFRWIDYSDYH